LPAVAERWDSHVCCGFRVRVEPGDWRRLTEALHEAYGYDLPAHIMPISERQGITFRASGYGHEAEPASWLLALKSAVGLYEELRRRGVPVDLFQREDPCEMRLLGEKGRPVDLSRLCRAVIERVETAQNGVAGGIGCSPERT
jgi:hypothetical protein